MLLDGKPFLEFGDALLAVTVFPWTTIKKEQTEIYTGYY
jgi:hypothetical protein